jgi:hypothetical protein
MCAQPGCGGPPWRVVAPIGPQDGGHGCRMRAGLPIQRKELCMHALFSLPTTDTASRRRDIDPSLGSRAPVAA